MALTDEVWVDTDAYCYRAFPKMDWFFAPDQKQTKRIANGVLRIPKSSDTLRNLIKFTSTDYPEIPTDWVFDNQYSMEDYVAAGGSGKVHLNDLPYTVIGPQAFGY